MDRHLGRRQFHHRNPPLSSMPHRGPTDHPYCNLATAAGPSTGPPRNYGQACQPEPPRIAANEDGDWILYRRLADTHVSLASVMGCWQVTFIVMAWLGSPAWQLRRAPSSPRPARQAILRRQLVPACKLSETPALRRRAGLPACRRCGVRPLPAAVAARHHCCWGRRQAGRLLPIPRPPGTHSPSGHRQRGSCSDTR